MTRKIYNLDKDVVKQFDDDVQRSMEHVIDDARETHWFTEACLYHAENQHSVKQPFLYLGIDREEDNSGVETHGILNKVKGDNYEGLSFAYYTDDGPVGEALVLSPSHTQNNRG